MLDKIPGMEQAFEDCDIVVGEIDFKALMSQEYQMALTEKIMVAPPDSTLDKLLTDEEYALVEQEFNKYFGVLGVNLQQQNGFKPNFIRGMILTMQMIQNKQDFSDYQDFPDMEVLESLSFASGKNGMDRAVQKRAEEMGRQSVALESIEEQCDMLWNVPLTIQAKNLLDACNNPNIAKTSFAQSLAILKAYMAQDLKKIHEIMTDPEIVDAGAIGALRVNERNLNWIEKLVKMIPDHACLVYVGAGHLPGDQGLIQLLRNEGFTVEPVQ